MKFLVLVLVAVFSTTLKADEQQLDRIAQVESECMKEKNVSEDQIKKAKAGEFSDADANKQNCFAECIFYKLDFMKPGSMDFDQEAIKKVAEEKGGEHYKSIAEKCLKQEASNACDLTYQIYKCFYQERAQAAMTAVKETPQPALGPEVMRALLTTGVQHSSDQAQPDQQAQQTQDQQAQQASQAQQAQLEKAQTKV